MDKLKNSRVAVFGIGGVGGYVCEALVRSGVGHFDLIDDDKVCLTKWNRNLRIHKCTILIRNFSVLNFNCTNFDNLIFCRTKSRRLQIEYNIGSF